MTEVMDIFNGSLCQTDLLYRVASAVTNAIKGAFATHYPDNKRLQNLVEFAEFQIDVFLKKDYRLLAFMKACMIFVKKQTMPLEPNELEYYTKFFEQLSEVLGFDVLQLLNEPAESNEKLVEYLKVSLPAIQEAVKSLVDPMNEEERQEFKKLSDALWDLRSSAFLSDEQRTRLNALLNEYTATAE